MSPRWSPSGSVTLSLLPLCGLLVSLDQHGLLAWSWSWPNALCWLAPHGVVLALCGWVPAQAAPPVVMLLLLDLLINC